MFLVWMVLLGYAPDPEIIRLQHFRAVNNRLIEFSDAEGTAAANAAAGALQTTSGAAGLSQGQSSS
ncbi:hypothetical protein, partial [Salmonella enterica]|uniref:hypothetical protein n=1 Tax=Salmonella enterica TaxID=28901 RepID=UPI003CF869B1